MCKLQLKYWKVWKFSHKQKIIIGHLLSTFSNYWLKSASKAHHWLAGVLWAHVRLK